MMDKHIGISGKMAAGKTKLADYLCENFGYSKYAFAMPMKEMEILHQDYKMGKFNSRELLDKLIPYIYKLNIPAVRGAKALLELYDSVPLVMPKNREFLQKLGTDVVRSFNPNAWVDYAINYLKEVDGPVVIDDMRFLNEATNLKENGFYLVRLEADEDLRRQKIVELYGEEALDPSRLNHPSEVQLDGYHDYDLVLTNNYDNRLESYASALQVILSKGR